MTSGLRMGQCISLAFGFDKRTYWDPVYVLRDSILILYLAWPPTLGSPE